MSSGHTCSQYAYHRTINTASFIHPALGLQQSHGPCEIRHLCSRPDRNPPSSDFSRKESGPPPLQRRITHSEPKDVLPPGGDVMPFDLPLVASVGGLGAARRHDPDIPNLRILLEFLSPPSILLELGVIHTAVHPHYLHIAVVLYNADKSIVSVIAALYCLNLKNLPYQMDHVEIPDVEALAEKISAVLTGDRPDGVSPEYTIPIIRDHSTGAVLSNSPGITIYLGKTYPSSGPVLIPAGTIALQPAFTDAVNEVFEHLRVPLFYADMVVKMSDRTALCMREILAGICT
ncbi:uncharacterized protein ARMOST_02165 [Armillaria ostoyae]|uniref:GST N-terminal domain-containing protein n=1 Tax=Armillaria ostoyae TaxID=47428 RepID=A0A284QQZ8_ARMOS|nr:uncharacterized protein ARMOST_02165 [Armillaria ostoyae]